MALVLPARRVWWQGAVGLMLALLALPQATSVATVCNQEEIVPWNRQRPMLVVVGAVEGSGHHLFGKALHHAAKRSPVSFGEGNIKLMMWPPRMPDPQRSELDPQAMWDVLTNSKQSGGLLGQTGGFGNFTAPPRVVNAGGSHPFGGPPNAFREVDLLTVSQMDTVLGKVDVRVLLFFRDPADAVLSVVRRGFNTDSETQAKMAEMNLAYLEGLIKVLPAGKILLVSYERALTHPFETGSAISKLLDAERDEDGGVMHQALLTTLAYSVGFRNGKPAPPRTGVYDVTESTFCRKNGLTNDMEKCFARLREWLVNFFDSRTKMYPTMASVLEGDTCLGG